MSPRRVVTADEIALVRALIANGVEAHVRVAEAQAPGHGWGHASRHAAARRRRRVTHEDIRQWLQTVTAQVQVALDRQAQDRRRLESVYQAAIRQMQQETRP